MDVRENPGSGNNVVTTLTKSAVKHCNAKKVDKEMKTNESFQMFYFYFLLKLCNKIKKKKKTVRKVTLQNIAEVAQHSIYPLLSTSRSITIFTALAVMCFPRDI